MSIKQSWINNVYKIICNQNQSLQNDLPLKIPNYSVIIYLYYNIVMFTTCNDHSKVDSWITALKICNKYLHLSIYFYFISNLFY